MPLRKSKITGKEEWCGRLRYRPDGQPIRNETPRVRMSKKARLKLRREQKLRAGQKAKE
jgi:hypothetical protein